MTRRGFVHLVGLGPGDEASMSVGAARALADAEEIWASDAGPWNRERGYLRRYVQGKKFVNLSAYYQLPPVGRHRIYRAIASRLLHLATRGRRITFALSGNPFVWVDLTDHLKAHAASGQLDLRVTPSMSFLDVIWQNTPISLRGALQVRASLVTHPDVSPDVDCVVGQVGDPGTTGRHDRLDDFCSAVRRLYPAAHTVFVVGSDPVYATQRSVATTVADLPRVLGAFSDLYHVVILPRVTAPRRTTRRS